MEQIVKMFVHQSYYIENDLLIDYNVEKEAQVNLSPKDWIALIPKGWSGVDDQVVFKTVDIDPEVNLAIKSVVIEKSCLQNVDCQKQYQLIYIGQYLEILGKSDFFVFLHKFNTCNCITSKANSKDSPKENRSSYVNNRKPTRRQSPTPHEFYKIQSQINILGCEKSKSKQQCSPNLLTCNTCNAPNNYTEIENSYLTKIKDLTKYNEMMEQRLLSVEKDLLYSMDVVNKQFKACQTILQQKDSIKQFIDDLIEGLLNEGKITFWAYEQQFSVVRENIDNDTLGNLYDDSAVSFSNTSLNSSKEIYMKSIIGRQEQTIQKLVSKIKDLFFKVNNKQNISISNLPEHKVCNMGYMDQSGTTYFSPPTCTTDLLNEVDKYLPNDDINIDENMSKINENIYKWLNNTTFDNIFSNYDEIVSASRENNTDKILTFKNWKNYQRKYNTQLPVKCSTKNNNRSNIFLDNKDDLEGSDDSI